MSFACSGWAVISPSPGKDSAVIYCKQSLSKDIKWIRISTIKNKGFTANKAHRWLTGLAACLNAIKSHQDWPACLLQEPGGHVTGKTRH